MMNGSENPTGAVVFAAGLFLFLLGIMVPQAALAQFRIEDYQKDAVGFGIWYGVGTLTFDAPPETATAEVKGYTAVLPTKASGAGPALGLSFGSFGLTVAFSDTQIEVKKKADVQQTPGSAGDDVFVQTARMTSRRLMLLFQPARFFYLGVGQEEGTIEFTQVSAAGETQTKRVAIDNKFYSVGLALGFDPTKAGFAPIVTVFARFPASRGNFSGTVFGAGVGAFF